MIKLKVYTVNGRAVMAESQLQAEIDYKIMMQSELARIASESKN